MTPYETKLVWSLRHGANFHTPPKHREALTKAAAAIERIAMERDEAAAALADGAYDDACKNGGSIYQHALALTVERFRAVEAECAVQRERADKAEGALVEITLAVQAVLQETDKMLLNDPPPIKYRAPYGTLAKLRGILEANSAYYEAWAANFDQKVRSAYSPLPPMGTESGGW